MDNDSGAFVRQDHVGLRKKYLHEREVGDALLDAALGCQGWRDCTTRVESGGTLMPFAPVRYRRQIRGVDPLLFDYSWNHLDQTQYLHWSVYHVLAEWVLPPDANGFGALNVGIQEVPATGGPLHHGLLDLVFASWDDPRPHCGFPIEADSALLMRFWNFDRAAGTFTLRNTGPVGALLIQWNPLPGGDGVDLWTTALTRDPQLGRDGLEFVDGDMAADMPHEDEESSSWGMAIRDLGRRRAFSPDGYRPVWKMTPAPAPAAADAFDRFSVDVLSDDELAGLDEATVLAATAALWQRYLGVKMVTDFVLRHVVTKPSELAPPLRELYEAFPVVGR